MAAPRSGRSPRLSRSRRRRSRFDRRSSAHFLRPRLCGPPRFEWCLEGANPRPRLSLRPRVELGHAVDDASGLALDRGEFGFTLFPDALDAVNLPDDVPIDAAGTYRRQGIGELDVERRHWDQLDFAGVDVGSIGRSSASTSSSESLMETGPMRYAEITPSEIHRRNVRGWIPVAAAACATVVSRLGLLVVIVT